MNNIIRKFLMIAMFKELSTKEFRKRMKEFAILITDFSVRNFCNRFAVIIIIM